MYFAINMPHYPLQGEKKWFDTYKNLLSPRNMYAVSVSTMDEKIGLLLKKYDIITKGYGNRLTGESREGEAPNF